MSAAEELPLENQNEPTLEELVALSCDLKNEHDRVKAQASEIYKRRETVNARIFELMEEAGTSSIGTSRGTALIVESNKARYTDRRAAFEFIKEADAIDLLPNTISNPAYQAYLDAGVEVPGVEAYTKRDLRVRRK